MKQLPRVVAVLATAFIFAVVLVPNANAVFILEDVPVADYVDLTNQFPQISDPAGYVFQGLGTSSLRPCSGTLVASTLFLTAAHCVDGWQAQNLFVGFGENFPPLTSPLSSNVAEITINPEYTAFPNAHDMAILRLTSPARETPAQILLANPINRLFFFEGYGAQGTSGELLSDGFTPMPGANNGLMALNILDEITTSGYFTGVFNTQGSGALGLEGIGGPGDSGAGAFSPWTIDGLLDFYLIGVLEGGSGTQIPTYGNIDFWSRVREPNNLAFLESFPQIEIVNVLLLEPNSLALIIIAIASLIWERKRGRAKRKGDGAIKGSV